MGRESLIRQVNVAILALNRLNRKKANKINQNKKPVGIYQGKTIKSYINLCCTFVKWAEKRYGIKYLRELTAEMGMLYLEGLISDGRSAYTPGPRQSRFET